MKTYAFMAGLNDGLEKRGIDPLSVAVGALGGHVLTNAGIHQAMKSPRFMPDVMRLGFQHGQARQKMAPLREAWVTKSLGPEIPYQYHQARSAGRAVRLLQKATKPHQKERLINMLKRKVGDADPGSSSMLDALRKSAPDINEKTSPHDIANMLHGARKGMKSTGKPELFEHVERAIGRERVHQRAVAHGNPSVAAPSIGAKMMVGTEKSRVFKPVHEHYKPTLIGRAAQHIPETAAAVGSLMGVPWAPKALGHFGVNIVRDAVSKTKVGKRVVQGQVEKGLQGGLNPLMQKIKTYAVSPGFSAIGNAAQAAGKVLKKVREQPSAPKRFANAAAGMVRRGKSKLQEFRERGRGVASPEATPPPA